MDLARRTNVQHQQHRPSVSASAPFGNQSMHSPREANFGSHPIGRAGVSAASTLHTSQTAQPPNAVPAKFVYSQNSGIPAIRSQASSGHASASGGTANYGVNHAYANLNERYASWFKAYGGVKAASMARDYMQSWNSQIHPTTTIPHSTIALPAVSMAQNLQRPSPYQVSRPEGVAVPPPPPPQTQEWNSFAPMASAHGGQMSSQHAPVAPPSHAPFPHTPANELTAETNAVRLARSTGDAYNTAEVQSHHPEVTTSSRVVTSTDRAPALSAPPSSQSDSTQSILLASEEKGKALYSMHGLAASIKRSLNAERLAASMEPSASSDPHGQKSKPLNPIEAVDTQHQMKSSTPDLAIGKSHEQGPDSKAGTQPVNLITEPVDSPSTIPPVSFSEVLIPHEETMRTANAFQIPNSQHDSSANFTPYSTLTGAVSFDNITDPIVLVEDPLISDQPSFEPLSFPHRTPTPPLAATITSVHDEGEVDEKADPTPSSRPSTPLHEIEIDSQLQYIPSGNEDDIEMSSVPGEDHVPTQPNIASFEFSQAWDNNTLMQDADVSIHQATPLDRSIEQIDRGSIGSPMVEEHPGNERRRSAPAPGELARVLLKTLPIRVQSTDSVEISSRGSLPKPPRKSRRKQKFYIAVPPASEWVLQAKRREAERKALMKEKAGEFGYLGTTSCYFLMHLRAAQ
ncbi:hypothetical protein F5888DRAFT_464783 [Russula emetica]|nr:hypothetical protein F5888DRAFT_464783 [Russula emetica]